MSEKKIRADLCLDHFEILLVDDVCLTCPSKFENKEIVRAMSRVLAASTDEAANTAFVTELRSIRRAISGLSEHCEKLDRIITGNGSGRGIDNRITAIESRLETSSKSIGNQIAIIGVIVSLIIAIASLIMGQN